MLLSPKLRQLVSFLYEDKSAGDCVEFPMSILVPETTKRWRVRPGSVFFKRRDEKEEERGA